MINSNIIELNTEFGSISINRYLICTVTGEFHVGAIVPILESMYDFLVLQGICTRKQYNPTSTNFAAGWTKANSTQYTSHLPSRYLEFTPAYLATVQAKRDAQPPVSRAKSDMFTSKSGKTVSIG